MKYDDMYPNVPDAEQTVRDSLAQRSHSFREFQIPVPNEGITLNGLLCRRQKASDNTYFYSEKTEKSMIVLHFTAGYLKGDIGALTTPDRHVSTSYLVGRDGTVYQLFSSSQWSYHLGRTAVGGNTTNSKRSVAIEISNIGPLRQSGNTLKDTYGNTYCSLDDTDAYTTLSTPYRGFTHYASFTDKQYEELIILLRYLTAVYDVPKTFLPEADRTDMFATSDAAKSYNGISSHVNYRRDKYDIGPAFDWQRVMDGVHADTYTPQFRIKSRSLSVPDINSVEELETEIATHMRGADFDATAMGEEGEESMDATVEPLNFWGRVSLFFQRLRLSLA